MRTLFKMLFVLVALLGVAIIGLAFWGMHDLHQYEAKSPAEREAEHDRYVAAQAEKDKLRLAENKDGHLCLNGSGWNTSLVDQLKPSLREPGSFEHISSRITPSDDNGEHTVTMRYRARNGFGGVSFGTTEALVSSLDCSAIVLETRYD